MQTKSSLLTYKTISRQEAQGYLLRAVDLVRGNLGQFTDCFPYSNSQGGFYQPGDNREWTTGFWTGEIWQAYEMTGEEAFRKAGAVQVESFLDRIERRIDTDNHDMGFYIPRPVWRPTG